MVNLGFKGLTSGYDLTFSCYKMIMLNTTIKCMQPQPVNYDLSNFTQHNSFNTRVISKSWNYALASVSSYKTSDNFTILASK